MVERSADLLVQNILADSDATEGLKTEPEATLKRAAAEAKRQLPLDTDPWVYRMVVTFLGLTVILVVAGTILLVLSGKEGAGVPDILTALGSAAVGALAGLLAPTPRA
ncbi:hypothetical protein [Bosea sp. (in: a-proteobacteria)]|uniref:hypothetical protein n=1 Tax=Bosea sp. (in: a-proteobacteria) TaxID=1871050 RepID=UPI003B3BCC0F